MCWRTLPLPIPLRQPSQDVEQTGRVKLGNLGITMSFDRNYKDSRILVKGAAGFIGSHFQALKGEPITAFGDGGQSRSFCYVDDLVEAITRLMLTDEGCTGPVNLDNSSEFTILELAEKVISYTNSRSKLIFEPLPQDDPRQRQPSLSEPKALLNWEPKVALADGLKETIACFKRSLELS
jgi:nucleoside-diphosphate-sugar epimerase